MTVVVLAYHEMGCVGLEVLLRRRVPVAAVFTYEDDPGENVWFRSVAEVARGAGIATYTPEDVNALEWEAHIRAAAPDVLFSFYYRHLVRRPIRSIPRLGCLNLHGSLLPRYRGRSPVNWQLVHGETVSGVTLHHMVGRADAGDVVDQEAVPVGPDDTALVLYRELLAAAERVLERSLAGVLAGTAPRRPQDEAQATTFGGRRPEDGRIDWAWSANRIHDLVRAVAPPWPGAFCDTPRGRIAVHRTRLCPPPGLPWAPSQAPRGLAPGTVWVRDDGATLVQTGDGMLELRDFVPPPGVLLSTRDTLVPGGGGSAAGAHPQDLAQRDPASPRERAERATEGGGAP